MELNVQFKIDKKEYMEIYRTHIKYKFKLHRSMIMSVALFCFGMIMQYGFSKDFNFINKFVFIIMIVSIVLNLFTDFILPKTVYNNLLHSKANVGKLKISDKDITFVHNGVNTVREWNYYDSCIESDLAFILYKKDIFTPIIKKSLDTHIDDVRLLLKNKVNKDKNLIFKK